MDSSKDRDAEDIYNDLREIGYTHAEGIDKGYFWWLHGHKDSICMPSVLSFRPRMLQKKAERTNPTKRVQNWVCESLSEAPDRIEWLLPKILLSFLLRKSSYSRLFHSLPQDSGCSALRITPSRSLTVSTPSRSCWRFRRL